MNELGLEFATLSVLLVHYRKEITCFFAKKKIREENFVCGFKENEWLVLVH